MNVWYAMPVATFERASQCIPRWQERGYRVAVAIDVGTQPPAADMVLQQFQYPGYWKSVNRLCSLLMGGPGAQGEAVLPRPSEWPLPGMPPDVIVAGGDDMFPDQTKTAQQIALEYYERFPDGFGVMQPTGDNLPGTDRICGSPWFGRGWLLRSYGGHGPFPEYYFHFCGDVELQAVASQLGVLWQRPDLTQYHAHWVRPDDSLQMQPYQRHNEDTHHRADREIQAQRVAAGWPGHEPLPQEETGA